MWKLLGALLIYLVEPIVARVAGAIGFGVVAYSGIKIVYDQIDGVLMSLSGSVAHDVYQLMSLIGFGDVLAVNMSALLIRAYLDGMNSAGSVVRSRFSVKD